MRLKNCGNCPNWGDLEEEKPINSKPHRGCHGGLPEMSADPRGIGRFPMMPRDGWCAHHGEQNSSTPTHTSADVLEFGPPEDQPPRST